MRKSRCDKTGRKDMGRQRGREGYAVFRRKPEQRRGKQSSNF
jgi:hypothetical protein